MTQIINTNENNNKMMIFEDKTIEIFVYNNEIMFNPRDVASCLDLEFKTVQNYMSEMNENQVLKITNDSASHLIGFRKLNNAGENFLTEKGVYKLIFKSRKPEAEKFQDWVTDVVLPTINKTGGYVSNSDMFINTYLPFADDNTKILFKQTLTVIEQQNKVIQEQKPKVEYFNAIVDRKLNVSFRDCAKQIAVPERKFIAWLEEEKYIFRQYRINSKGKEVSIIKPYAQYVPSLFEIKDFAGEHKAGVQTLITPKGKETFRLLTEHLRK